MHPMPVMLMVNWGHGTNGGYGFEPWTVSTSGTTDGQVGNPASIGIIGMDNPSFYLQLHQDNHIPTYLWIDHFRHLLLGWKHF
jgi:hypothetical protein